MAQPAKTKSARKAKVEEPRQTRKQLSLGRKEARQKRIVWLAVGALAALILAILAAGILSELVIKPAQPVVKVNGAKATYAEFSELLTYRRYSLHSAIGSIQEVIDSLGAAEDETTSFLLSYYQQQLGQYQAELGLSPQAVADELVEDLLVQEKAQELGLTVTQQEITAYIHDDIQQGIAQQAMQAQTSITDTTLIPTPTPLAQADVDRILDNYYAAMGLSADQFARVVGRGLLREKVQEYLADQVPATGLVIHVELIKTETEEQATAAQARIEGGEEFALVAREVSTDTLSAEDGGDLGWLAATQLQARYGKEVEDAAFGAAAGELVQVEGNGSFYLLRVRERDENGPLPEAVLNPKKSSALNDWLAERKLDPAVTIERYLDKIDVPPDPFTTAF